VAACGPPLSFTLPTGSVVGGAGAAVVGGAVAGRAGSSPTVARQPPTARAAATASAMVATVLAPTRPRAAAAGAGDAACARRVTEAGARVPEFGARDSLTLGVPGAGMLADVLADVLATVSPAVPRLGGRGSVVTTGIEGGKPHARAE
jgi:hypothetical protein